MPPPFLTGDQESLMAITSYTVSGTVHLRGGIESPGRVDRTTDREEGETFTLLASAYVRVRDGRGAVREHALLPAGTAVTCIDAGGNGWWPRVWRVTAPVVVAPMLVVPPLGATTVVDCAAAHAEREVRRRAALAPEEAAAEDAHTAAHAAWCESSPEGGDRW